MRVLLFLLLFIVILGKTSSAGPKQRFKKRLGRLGKKRNAFKKGRFSAGTFLRNSGKNGGILKRLDKMDDNFAFLGVQIADMLEYKEHINSQLSEIKNDNLDRHEAMDEKMEEMNQNIKSLGLLMDNMLKNMRYMNDTMQNMHTDIKTNIAEGGPSNRGKVE